MLKQQDCIILLKLLANPRKVWSQRELASALCISLSETNEGLKRLVYAGLLRKLKNSQYLPILAAAEEFFISSVKYLVPAKLGAYTRGVPTAVGAPLFHDKIAVGDGLVPVWPDATGESSGVALDPLHPAVPKALRKSPDQNFYELLVLVDSIRSGKPRERNMAIKLLKQRLNKNEKKFS